MRSIVVSVAFFLIALVSGAQSVGINADGSSPNVSAMLDVRATNKGLLIPNVALTGSTDASTITTPAVSLLVYNTATVSNVTPGYYYNSGSGGSPVWTRLVTTLADGSETKVTAGTNVTVTGTGTSVNPYVVNVTAANGSETKVTAGTNITMTGTGTSASPYVVNATAATGSETKVTAGNNITLTGAGTTASPYVVSVTAAIAYGDIKQGIQSTDHNGWIKLDGRLKSSLTATQQTQATALGIGTNLPDASNSFPVQNGATLGSVSGSNTVTITQANLPNVSFAGTAASAGSHTHPLWGDGTNGAYSGTIQTSDRGSSYSGGNTSAAGSHSHSVSVSSGGSGTALNITPQSLSVNMFIYLGL